MNKKHGLLLGASIAIAGVAASMTVAYSLYKKVGDDIEIGIGAYTPSSDAFIYRVGDVTKDAGVLSPGVGGGYTKTDTTSFDVGGQYPTATKNGESVISQNFYVGFLTVDITGAAVNEGNVTDVMSVVPTLAYKAGTGHVDSWWKNNLSAVASPEKGHITFKGHIAFGTGATNDVDVSLALTTTIDSDANAVAFGNKAYSVTIKFEEATKANGFDWLYVRGDKYGWSASTDYRLVPNLASGSTEEKIEYMFNGLPGSIGEMKLANEDWTVSAGTGDEHEGNLTPSQSDKTYDVYWHGSNSGKKLLSESESEGNYYINAN